MPRSTEFEPHESQQPDPFNEERVWELLSSYIDGELTPEEQEALHGLLAKSPQWQRELVVLKATTQILRKEAEVEPPAHLRGAILAATVNRRTWHRHMADLWRRRRFAGSVVLSGGALALVVALWVAFIRFNAISASHSPTRPTHIAALPQAPVLHRLNHGHALSSHPLRAKVMRTTSSRPGETLIAKLVAPLRSKPLMPDFDQQPAQPVAASLSSGHHAKVAQAAQPVRQQTSLHAKPSMGAPTTGNSNSAAGTMVQMAAVFSPVPGMDQINQPAFSHHVGDAMDVSGNQSAGGSAPSSQTSTTGQKPSGPTASINNSSNATTTAGGTTTLQPTGDKKPVANQGDTPLAYMAYLPPDALKFRSTASIKRELSERNLGLSRIAIENTEQRQARIVLVSGRF
ncbi:MAG TPA: hypothetical protein VKV18_08255 [Chthonomonas sp.]|uniref:anti-sigma factor family protein n=1 Tax=Chthonomonas sp. TaxID=2282153 RepID=UPI002B4B4B03|nr:hypothetical protein [Chthonomonas sp.]HLI48661.1 hypothetical protein [Chthonomonas sp.]